MDIEKFPDKITRTILTYPGNMTLKLHVRLKDANNKTSYHSEFEYNNNLYLSINPTVYLTIDIIQKDMGSYDNSKRFVIGIGNIGSVLKLMNSVLNSIYKEKIFAIKNNEIVIFTDMANAFTKQLSIPRMNQFIRIRPSIVYDENEVSYEGVSISINKQENIIELSIDEYENLIYTLGKIDLVTYSQLLINYFVLYYKQTNVNKPKPVKKQINWNDNVPKEITTSNLKKVTDKEDDIFEDLLST